MNRIVRMIAPVSYTHLRATSDIDLVVIHCTELPLSLIHI